MGPVSPGQDGDRPATCGVNQRCGPWFPRRLREAPGAAARDFKCSDLGRKSNPNGARGPWSIRRGPLKFFKLCRYIAPKK